MPNLNPLTVIQRAVAWMRRVNASLQQLNGQQAELKRQLDSIAGDLSSLTAMTGAVSETVGESRRATMIAVRRLSSIRARVRVVFLVHNATAWGSIAELIELMQHDAEFDPVVVSIPHRYSGVGPAKGEGRTHRFLQTADVPHLRLRKDQLDEASQLLRALDPDIVVRQSQWDDDIDPAFSADALSWARLVLIPYETMNIIENVPVGDPPINSAVDTVMHRNAWLVFLANEEALNIARADSLTGALQFRAVGHPKLDYVRATEADWPVESTETRARRVLWSAHHSILTGWNDFGMFPQVREQMLGWAKASPETEFVFTHHPLLPGTIEREGSPLSPDEYDAWLDQWKSLPNTAVWRGNYATVLSAADYLVTDGPSMTIEGQLLNVPTVFMERPDHIPFNEIGREVACGVHRVHSVEDAQNTIRDIEAHGSDPLAERQAANVSRFFGEPGAAGRILEVIRAEIAADRIVTNRA
ncbi:hypothetical protein ACIPV2_03525 [Microbacterium sp. NPDC089987]|uniref:hypothetical protein n=1 Tax=Microbacterium sp. NPDC089987 TaxID=3364202 RepID=UPI0037FE7182